MTTTWRWPTAEECYAKYPLTDEQRIHRARSLERAARRLAAVICRECDMARQPVHVPVVDFLVLLREASEWTPPAPVETAPQDTAPEETADGSAADRAAVA